VVDPQNLALAYSLSTVAGLRASLTILAVAIAVHLHAFTPPNALAWLASDTTLYVVGALVVADFFADKIPVVDHVLHLVHAGLAPAAGGIAAASLDGSGGGDAVVFALLGAGNALGIHALRSTTRVGATAVSFGILNPILSIVEDGLAVVALALAFIAPFVMAALAIAATIGALIAGRRFSSWTRRKRSGPSS
jgi:hypothetical protein